jgi:hypothetical protein
MPTPKPLLSPRTLSFLIAGAILIAIVAVGSVATRPVLGKITVDTRPSGAAVLLADHYCPAAPCDFELAPGEYKVEASLQNHEHAEATIQVTAHGSAYKTLHLLPMLPTDDEAKRMGLIKRPDDPNAPIELK